MEPAEKSTMREHPLRTILSRILRGSTTGSDAELFYLHRGAANDEVKIMVSTISRLGKGWFMLPDGETQIPYHRVLRVRDLHTGKILWEKRKPGSTSSLAL